MGGGVAMKMLIRQPRSIASVTLVDPISPFGYGGSRDVEGTPCYADGAPAGAGMVNPEFVSRLRERDRGRSSPLSPRRVMEDFYFSPPFVPDRIGALLTGMLEARVGDDWYPGDVLASENWPGSAPGERGVLNAMSRRYFDASAIVEVDPKPPLLWLRGELDQIVADGAALEMANLGALGQVPGCLAWISARRSQWCSKPAPYSKTTRVAAVPSESACWRESATRPLSRHRKRSTGCSPTS